MTEATPRTILVSACLLGLRTRYDGETRSNDAVIDFITRGNWLPIPICPEQLGGLPTPRPDAEFKIGDGAALLAGNGLLVNRISTDVGSEFLQGAEQTAAIASLCHCSIALLKERSPSCGVHYIYRNGELIKGSGVTAAHLQLQGLSLFSEEDLVDGRLPEQKV